MSAAAFLRFKKLVGGGKLGIAARHNRRAVQAEWGASGSIDPARTHLNVTLVGPATAADVVTLAKALMSEAQVKPLRRDAVRAIETVFSLPTNHQLDEVAYFQACVDWLGTRLGGPKNILSADIHRDEAAPHCHVLSLPLISGRMVGSDLIGNRATLEAHTESFYAEVGSRFGLARPKRLSHTDRRDASDFLIKHLRQIKDAVLQSNLWPTLRAAIEHDPLPHFQALGMEPPTRPKPLKTMTQIFTSPGKGPKKDSNPIGFASSPKPRTLCSVGFSTDTAPTGEPTPARKEQESTDLAKNKRQKWADQPSHARAPLGRISPPDQAEQQRDHSITRSRDEELRASWFNPDTGEFCPP